MAEFECSYCPFSTDEGWTALQHRDEHSDHPEVVEGRARLDALLASLPDTDGSGSGS